MKSKIMRIVISPQALFDIVQNKTSWKVSVGLPITALLRGFTLDPNTQCLNLFIEDPSFEEIDVTTQVAPVFEMKFVRLVQK